MTVLAATLAEALEASRAALVSEVGRHDALLDLLAVVDERSRQLGRPATGEDLLDTAGPIDAARVANLVDRAAPPRQEAA